MPHTNPDSSQLGWKTNKNEYKKETLKNKKVSPIRFAMQIGKIKGNLISFLSKINYYISKHNLYSSEISDGKENIVFI